MNFWRQLRFLLWKNFLIRRRQKVWIAIELVWPVVLFLILVWVRTREISIKFPECHYPAKALPSAGLLPFVQSYLCTLQNTCHKSPFEDDEIGKANDYEYSVLGKLAKLVEDFLNQPEAAGDVQNLLDKALDLVNFTLAEFDPDNPFTLLAFDQESIQPKLDALLVAANRSSIAGLMEAFRLFYTGANSSSNSSMDFISTITCGQQRDMTSIFKLKSSKERMREKMLGKAPTISSKGLNDALNFKKANLWKPEENITLKVVCNDFLIESDLDEKCMAWLGTLMPKAMLMPFFSLLRGHILVSPENEATIKLVQKLQKWLQAVDWVKISVMDLYKNADVYQDSLANSKLAKTYKKLLELAEMCKLLGVSSCVKVYDQMEKFQGLFFNSTDSNATLSELKERIAPIAFMLQCFLTDRFRFAPNEFEMEKRAMCLMDLDIHKYFTGLHFNISQNATEFPPMVSYKIRMPEYLVDGSNAIRDRVIRLPRDRPFIDLKYLYFGFSFLQDAVDSAIIELQTNKTQNIGVYSQQFPFPCFQLDGFVEAIERLLPMLMVMAWVFSAALITKNIVYEKEMRLKEFMKMMGLDNLVHWVAWFVQSFVFIFISVVIFVIVIKFGRIIQHSDLSVLFVFVLLFTAATITQCFFLSTLFGNANVAAAVVALIYFLLYLPYVVLTRYVQTISMAALFSSYLSAQTAFAWGCSCIADWENVAVGVHWYNVHSTPFEDGEFGQFTLAFSMWMMVVDSAIYLILTWYIEAVFPGQYGMPRPFYFFLLRSYWCSVALPKKTLVELEEIAPESKKYMETEPTELPLGVAVRNLKKVYPNGKTALSGVSLNFYESQITSFLGHNGAGKTTTMSIITGLFPPTDGTVLVYGRDVRSDIDEIRKSLGMCPQHNILYGTLTVEEQLSFYAGLKGVPIKQIKNQVKEMMEELGLTEKADTHAKNLSGGTQRRLSVAAAFIGGSKTVILDEPTAGVDPCARRQIWDLLLRKKEGRTIILSTHFMDEADVLGDRIAIIGDGRLRCCGSSMFLKKCYGSGYRLSMVRKKRSVAFPLAMSLTDHKCNEDSSSETSTQASESAASLEQSTNEKETDQASGATTNEQLHTFITTSLPGATFIEDLGREFTYKLPSENPKSLQEFFVRLESKMAVFDISSYGVSETKLEEIFIKAVGSEGSDEQGKKPCWPSCCPNLRRKFMRWRRSKTKNQNPIDDLTLMESSDDDSDGDEQTFDRHFELYERSNSVMVTFRHLGALLTKRGINFLRNYKGAFCEILAPIVMVAIVMYFLGFEPSTRPNPRARPLVPWWYGENNYVFMSMDNTTTDVMGIVRAMEEPPGLGVRCAKNPPLEKFFKCKSTAESNYTRPTMAPQDMWSSPKDTCHCDERSIYMCPVGSYKPEPPEQLANTTDVLVDMTGRSIAQWLIMTEQEFRGKRFGGFSLGELNSAAVENISWSIVDGNIQVLIEMFKKFSQDFDIDWKNGRRSPMSMIIDPNSPDFVALSTTEEFKKLLHGLEVKNNVKIWFNNQGWFSLPAYANVLSNAILRRNLPSEIDPSEFGITVYNHPMNYSIRSQAHKLTSGFNVMRLSFEACMLILAFSIVPASFVLFIIEEDIVSAKHLQFVSGVRPWLYWASNFLWDMINFMIPVLGTIALFFIFDDDAYIGWPKAGAGTFCLLFLYGFAIIPWMYPFSFLFRVPSVAFIMLTMGNAFIGWISTVTTMALERLGEDDPELTTINDVLMIVFLMFPQFCLGRGLVDMKQARFMYLGMKFMFDDATPVDPFRWDIIGRNFLCLFVEGCLGFIVVLILEYRRQLTGRCRQEKDAMDQDEDEDVRYERDRINALRDIDFALKVRNLSKIYGGNSCGRTPPTRAVDNLCLGVKPGECFGLLGVNGAGKTTTFNMLTGKSGVTSGDALINGASILSKMDQVSRQVGYCPQSDALHPLLTGREELRFYARLKGVKSDLIEKVVSRSISQLGLKLYADRRAGTYSGGNRRKLSTAIALLGCPAIVLLDEPTTGMDPKARRFLWNRITEVVRDGKTSVILTSHSMEECEALCSRLGIMVNGRFRCIGSIQHLKSRFGRGYTLTIKIGGTRPKTEEAIAFIRGRFPTVELKEQHLSLLRFQLPPTVRALSDVFACMVDAMNVLHVDDYTLSQTTLEQVFLSFAQEQGDAAMTNGAAHQEQGATAL